VKLFSTTVIVLVVPSSLQKAPKVVDLEVVDPRAAAAAAAPEAAA
jgi:hypothetical protein